MKIAPWLPLCIAPSVAALSFPAEAIRFAPAAGARVEKTFEQELSLSQVGHTTVVDGETQSEEGGQELSQHLALTLVDEYVAVAEGHPTELRRRFDSLTMTSKQNEPNPLAQPSRGLDLTLKSPLEGRTVVFRHEDDSADPTRALVDEGGELDATGDVLAGLTEDTDLRAFLPPSPEVAAGARWSIDPGGLARVLAPAGDLRFEPLASSLPPAIELPADVGSSPLDGWVSGEVEGAALATFRETAVVDGHRCAVIDVELELSSSRDTTESAREKFAAVPLPDDGETAIELDFSEAVCVLQGGGELVWDLEAGRFRSLTLDARVGIVIDTGATLTVGDTRQELEIRDEFTGTLRVQQDARAE